MVDQSGNERYRAATPYALGSEAKSDVLSVPIDCEAPRRRIVVKPNPGANKFLRSFDCIRHPAVPVIEIIDPRFKILSADWRDS